jgi:hypothetical protein
LREGAIICSRRTRAHDQTADQGPHYDWSVAVLVIGAKADSFDMRSNNSHPDALKLVNDPDLHRDIVARLRRDPDDDGRVAFTIELTTPRVP